MKNRLNVKYERKVCTSIQGRQKADAIFCLIDDRSDLANVSTSSIGNAIAERLVSFGQKVIGTLGYVPFIGLFLIRFATDWLSGSYIYWVIQLKSCYHA